MFLQVNIPQGYQLDSDPNLDEINLFEENTSKVSKSKNNYVTTLNFRQDNYGLVKKIILNLDYSSILPLGYYIPDGYELVNKRSLILFKMDK